MDVGDTVSKMIFKREFIECSERECFFGWGGKVGSGAVWTSAAFSLPRRNRLNKRQEWQ